MDIRIRGGRVVMTHKLEKDETYKINNGKKVRSVSIYKKPTTCIGYSSRTEDNKDILLLDYDNVLYDVVKEDVSYLQGSSYLPQAYIFTTGEKNEGNGRIGNYHVIFLQKLLAWEILALLRETHSDKAFITSPLRNIARCWVLRLSPKRNKGVPKFLEIYENKKESKRVHFKWSWHSQADISTAHKKLLSKFYPQIKHPRYTGEDGLRKVKLHLYETGIG